MRALLFVCLIACGGSEPAAQPVTLPASPSASASAVQTRKDDPVGQIHDAIPRWLDLLARGEDERFIDEVVVPEQMADVLGSKTKAELVSDFKRDKHEDVVKVLKLVQSTKPDEVKREGERTFVKWDNREGVRHVTFVVEGDHVWIKN